MAECPICNSMIDQMCSAHDDKKDCKTTLDKLENKGIFKAMLEAEVFTDDFKKNVIKDSVDLESLDKKERKEFEKFLNEKSDKKAKVEEPVEEVIPTVNPEKKDKSTTVEKKKPEIFKPLSLKGSVKATYDLFRGKPI